MTVFCVYEGGIVGPETQSASERHSPRGPNATAARRFANLPHKLRSLE